MRERGGGWQGKEKQKKNDEASDLSAKDETRRFQREVPSEN